MGAQWKQAGREANAQKKGQMVAKLVRELMVAAKLGGVDPDLNPRLAAAVEKAKKASVYKDTIERAIKKGSGQTDEKVSYETVIYEGFAPHKVPVVVECVTDNRSRTAPEIRKIFEAGSLGQPGCVSFFFNHCGVVEATHTDANRDAETDAIEAGAQEVEPLEAEEVPALPGLAFGATLPRRQRRFAANRLPSQPVVQRLPRNAKEPTNRDLPMSSPNCPYRLTAEVFLGRGGQRTRVSFHPPRYTPQTGQCQLNYGQISMS